MGVLQWNSLIALNYAAKNKGVRRGMNAFDALEVTQGEMAFVHVATMVETSNNI